MTDVYFCNIINIIYSNFASTIKNMCISHVQIISGESFFYPNLEENYILKQ